jgi:hypothetical protein
METSYGGEFGFGAQTGFDQVRQSCKRSASGQTGSDLFTSLKPSSLIHQDLRSNGCMAFGDRHFVERPASFQVGYRIS